MSVFSSDLVAYIAQNAPSDDTSLAGGPINPLVRVVFSQPSLLHDAVEVVSSDFLDTNLSVTVVAMASAGLIVTEVLPLEGILPVDFSSLGAIDHLESVLLSGPAQGTVTVRRASDRQLIAQIPPGELGVQRLFATGAFPSTAGPKSYWAKYFIKNTNPTSGVFSAAVQLTPDAGGFITHCVAAAVNDSGTTVNRITQPPAAILAPPGLFNTTTQNVPSNQLLAGQAIGIWIQMVLPSNSLPINSTFAATLTGAVGS